MSDCWGGSWGQAWAAGAWIGQQVDQFAAAGGPDESPRQQAARLRQIHRNNAAAVATVMALVASGALQWDH